ncbi:hypothetical protein [Deinococcus sp. QL22]|uniref:hypothetical protein n=1 Tax=Deinococcus sp. QL22 TaxID=2939437 RepID=UPI002017BC5B|nr:hypothetical protein [Deinococcus sp. QL22]UQN10364.1 hypothetical protein M1R55_29880 [Deinococcus sp. QL22]UQN10498.1 hypothetical protein M1R55_29205 [Deinococcus sp. QL22]
MEHYPAYTWRAACDEASLVLAVLFGRIPGIHYKRAWPVAQLTAMLGNVNGGKSKGGGNTPDWKLFKGSEFLPAYARTPDLDGPQLLAPHHCAALAEALENKHLAHASWVVQLVAADDSLERIFTVAEQYLALDAGAPA